MNTIEHVVWCPLYSCVLVKTNQYIIVNCVRHKESTANIDVPMKQESLQILRPAVCFFDCFVL